MDLNEAVRRAALELRDLRKDTYESERCPKSGRCDADLEDHLAELDQICDALERGVSPRCPPAPTYTNEPPTEPGWYWFKTAKRDPPTRR